MAFLGPCIKKITKPNYVFDTSSHVHAFNHVFQEYKTWLHGWYHLKLQSLVPCKSRQGWVHWYDWLYHDLYVYSSYVTHHVMGKDMVMVAWCWFYCHFNPHFVVIVVELSGLTINIVIFLSSSSYNTSSIFLVIS